MPTQIHPPPSLSLPTTTTAPALNSLELTGYKKVVQSCGMAFGLILRQR